MSKTLLRMEVLMVHTDDVVTPLDAWTLARCLHEPEVGTLQRCLEALGAERCATLLAETLTIEAGGGCPIPRRPPCVRPARRTRWRRRPPPWRRRTSPPRAPRDDQ